MSLVEVWIGHLDRAGELAGSYLPLLSPDELDRARRFAYDHLRHEYIMGRGLTRRILASRIDLDPRCIRFHYGPRGKPYLADQPAWHFNVSHSHKLLVCAMTASAPIGVDIERVQDIKDVRGIAERFFSAEEARTLDLLPEESRPAAFFECWTRKEAFIKATGEGLARSLANVVVTFGPGSIPRFERIEDPPDDTAAWTLKAFAPAENYIGAVAVRAPAVDLRLETVI